MKIAMRFPAARACILSVPWPETTVVSAPAFAQKKDYLSDSEAG